MVKKPSHIVKFYNDCDINLTKGGVMTDLSFTGRAATEVVKAAAVIGGGAATTAVGGGASAVAAGASAAATTVAGAATAIGSAVIATPVLPIIGGAALIGYLIKKATE